MVKLKKFNNTALMTDFKCPKCDKFIHLLLPVLKKVPVVYGCECGKTYKVLTNYNIKKNVFSMELKVSKMKNV
jgi:hypothetical protein